MGKEGKQSNYFKRYRWGDRMKIGDNYFFGTNIKVTKLPMVISKLISKKRIV